jgi:acetyl esterase/lipase
LPFRLAGLLTAVGERPGLGGPLPLGIKRRWLDAASVSLPFPDGTVIRRVTLAGRPGFRVSVGATERPRAIVHLHGGGYWVGSPYAYRSMAAFLAEAARAVVYLPDYRLAPENPYPAALDDALASCEKVAAEHDSFALSGDSAGGGLAVATARRLIDAGRPSPSGLALASPWVDPAAPATGRTRDLIISSRVGHRWAKGYIGRADARDPGIAPLHGRLDGLPPTLIHVCRTEVLYDQVTMFAKALHAAGVDVRVTEQRLWHAGIAQAGMVRDAHDAVGEFGRFLQSTATRV